MWCFLGVCICVHLHISSFLPFENAFDKLSLFRETTNAYHTGRNSNSKTKKGKQNSVLNTFKEGRHEFWNMLHRIPKTIWQEAQVQFQCNCKKTWFTVKNNVGLLYFNVMFQSTGYNAYTYTECMHTPPGGSSGKLILSIYHINSAHYSEKVPCLQCLLVSMKKNKISLGLYQHKKFHCFFILLYCIQLFTTSWYEIFKVSQLIIFSWVVT